LIIIQLFKIVKETKNYLKEERQTKLQKLTYWLSFKVKSLFFILY